MKPLRHKFGAKPTQRDSIRFPSKLEANSYQALKQLQQGGHIRAFLRQIPFDIPGGKHVVDFMVFTSDEVLFIESKGKDLAEGKRKRLAVQEIYDFPIHVIHDPKEIYQLLSIT